MNKDVLKGLAGALLLAALLYAGYAAHSLYWWKQYADVRGYRSDVAFSYLAETVTLADGTQVTRAQLLDALAKQLAQAHIPKK